MTIEKGSEWGSVVAEMHDGVEARGDLARDLGVDPVGISAHTGPWRRLPIDAVEITAKVATGDERVVTTCGWVRCGRRYLADLVIVSSTSFVDGRRLFSRAHPNDGRFDWLAIDASMPRRQRLTFWRRTRTETHLPHPLVRSGSGPTHTFTFNRPVTLVSSEGERIAKVSEVKARVIPDATATYIPSL